MPFSPLARSRLKALAPFLVGGAFAVGAVALQRAGWLPTCVTIQGSLRSTGAQAGIVYVVAATLSTLVFIPRTVTVVAASVGFDFWTAVLLVTLSSQLGAVLCFVIARTFGRSFVQSLAERKGWRQKLASFVAENQLVFVMMTRFIHVLPYSGVNYGTGLLPVSFAAYFWGTFLGMLPGTIMFNYIGAKLGCALVDGEMALPTDVKWKLLLSGVGISVIGLVPLWVLARRRARR